MEVSRRFMPLLTELGGWEMDFCYRHVAPNSAPALQRRLFSGARKRLSSARSGLCYPDKRKHVASCGANVFWMVGVL
jgi:hypothetical protein